MMNRLDKYYEAHPQQLMRRTHHNMLMLPPPPLVDTSPSGFSQSRSSTWATYHSGKSSSGNNGFSVLERGERIKPERSNKRNNVQKMQWRSSRWVNGFPYATSGDEDFDNRISSMTIADVSPRFAVKRIILLYENFQYREAANFINRLSHGTFKVILNDLPIDLFVESMPHSLSILEALYAKVFLSDGLNFSMKLLRPEGVIMQMVKFFSNQESIDKTGDKNWELCGPFICSCKKLLKVIVLSDPKIKKVLQQRRRSLDKAIEGLGQHGLVGTTDETLMNLHDALKMEFQRVVETYKGALQKLEELSLASNKNGVTRGPAPVQASHQRQLSLRQPEIQERLIKNKTLLNVVEPTLGNHSLDILLGILQRRIEFDKDVLFQFTQLRKEMKDLVEANSVVAPVLMRFSHGCDQVLELMKEVAEDEDDSSDISGYHSDSDSAIMMSGNSPYVSKRARYNFLSRSVRSSTKSSSVRTSVLLQQLSSSSGDSAGQRHQGLHHCSSGSDSPPHSLLVTDPTDCTKGSRSPDSSSTSSANSHPAGRPVTRSQIKHKNQLHKLNSEGSNSSCGAVTCCQGCQSRASLQVQPSSNDEELMTLRGEIRRLQTELGNANARLQESEQQLKEREQMRWEDNRPTIQRAVAYCSATVYVSKQEGQMAAVDNRARLASPSASTEAPSDPGSLVRCYGNLYAAARVDALDSLDNLPALKDADELKSKILFSVVVLAFRSAQSLLALKKDHIRRILHIQPPAVTPQVGTVTPSGPEAAELERSVAVYLRRTVDKFDLTKSVEDVCCQIWATLYDYPCLKSCPGLVQYVKDAVRLAWGLVNQSPPFILEYEQRTLRRDVHVRFHSSNPESDQIRTYLWPALLEGAGGPCVHKAVVIT